jgi:hypothetical protein
VQRGRITAEALAGTDVLVLINVPRQFPPAEKQLIHAFVQSGGALLALGGGAAGLLVGLWTFGAWPRAAYPLPSPHTDGPTLAFEQSPSDFWIPDRNLRGGSPRRGFHPFFVGT